MYATPVAEELFPKSTLEGFPETPEDLLPPILGQEVSNTEMAQRPNRNFNLAIIYLLLSANDEKQRYKIQAICSILAQNIH